MKLPSLLRTEAAMPRWRLFKVHLQAKFHSHSAQEELTLSFRVLAALSTFLTFFILGCEGGKPKDTICDPSAREPYDHCTATQQCPTGQIFLNGECRVPSGGCDINFTEIDGVCQPTTLECPPGEHEDSGLCVADQLDVALLSRPACWIPATGAARIIVQYTVKDESGRNLVTGEEQTENLMTTLFVDGKAMDLEAQLSSDSELLKSDLVLSLVLDASYSMLKHQPPAFEPMKDAAQDILHETQALWAQTSSDFYWQLLWFDSALYRPLDNMAGEPWSIDDIAVIPDPVEGTYTALYKAINKMITTHQQLYDANIAAGPRDQHIMLVLSDGDDNQAHVDNSDLYNEESVNMRYWRKEGGGTTDLSQVQSNLSKASFLRTFVIGFGSLVDEDLAQTLKNLADSGGGQYFYGANANNLDELFSAVQKEFITLQTLGVEVPLAPDEYTFSLVAKHPQSGSEGREDFTLQVGPELGECEPQTTAEEN